MFDTRYNVVSLAGHKAPVVLAAYTAGFIRPDDVPTLAPDGDLSAMWGGAKARADALLSECRSVSKTGEASLLGRAWVVERPALERYVHDTGLGRLRLSTFVEKPVPDCTVGEVAPSGAGFGGVPSVSGKFLEEYGFLAAHKWAFGRTVQRMALTVRGSQPPPDGGPVLLHAVSEPALFVVRTSALLEQAEAHSALGGGVQYHGLFVPVRVGAGLRRLLSTEDGALAGVETAMLWIGGRDVEDGEIEDVQEFVEWASALELQGR